MDIKKSIRRYLSDNVMMGEDVDAVRDDASFLAHNLLDSTGVLELVDFLEDSFGITIADQEIVPQNLDSLDRIAAYIERKRAVGVQAA